MRKIAMTRKIDSLGRFGIPKEILYMSDIALGESVEIFLDAGTGTLSLGKYIGQACKFCQSTEGLSTFKNSLICSECKSQMIALATQKDKRKHQPKEVMAQLLLDLLEKYPDATQQQYADMLRIPIARLRQLQQTIS
ncbi:AbrB/MazE/SpoVT family DNA-binding domain-containing protein [Paenibacillus terrae]|uniref:AbrB/MazE/SpoVT family DNA-binding domain-containing protein n=1 Tax=Paenibacillus terrae TaxID=159743 RepID=UPI000AAD7DD6|nr:AbrB/MazE/SpoVT family DNA-binding domain-containing protein [Paenibacillus terrae]